MAKKDSTTSTKPVNVTKAEVYNPEAFKTTLGKYSNVVDPKTGQVKKYAFPINKQGQVVYAGPIVQHLNPLTNSIKDYQSTLNSYMAANKLDQLTPEQANEALKAANKGDYSTYLSYLNDYNQLRDLTPLNRRDTTTKYGLTDVEPGDANQGAVLRYSETSPYDSTHTNIFAPYAKGGTVKRSKYKAGYAAGTGLEGTPDPSMLSPSDKAIYDKLPPESQAEFLSTKIQSDQVDQTTGSVNSSVSNIGGKAGAGLGWFAAANTAKELGKSLIKRDEFGNPITNTGDAADELLTPDHEQMIKDIKNKEYGLALLDSTGLGKFARAGMKLTGNQDATKGVAGFINKNIGITDENKKRKDLEDLSIEASQERAPEINRLKDGGPIKGKGTAKSDSIKAKVKPGSFVVPAENADKAEMIREKYLSGKNKNANLNQKGGAPVKLSNGEHLFNPNEKKYLESIGIDLSVLAPNANDSNMKANGGGIGDEEAIPGRPSKKDYLASMGLDLPSNNVRVDEDVYTFPGSSTTTTTPISMSQPVVATTSVSSTNNQVPVTPKKDKAAEDFDWLSLLGPAQAGLGVASLVRDGKRPIDKLSSDYLSSINTARGAATYGFDLPTKTQYEKAIESARISNVNLAGQIAGGNAGYASALARKATNDYAKNLLGLASEDERLKQSKEQYLNTLIADKENRERRLFEDKLNAFNVNQESGAGMLQAGILSMQNYAKNKRYEDLLTGLSSGNNNDVSVTIK